MTAILHPVADGLGIGSLQVVGDDGTMARFAALTPIVGDDRYVTLSGEQASGFDTRLQSRTPIALGDGTLRARFARLSGTGGIQVAMSLWRTNPATVSNGDDLIASVQNVGIWHDDFREYALQLLGRNVDQLARYMGDIWIRTIVVAAVGGAAVPTLGIASMWLEVPDAVEGRSFQDPAQVPPPENKLVTVRLFFGRSGVAKSVAGEWYDENGSSFERDRSSLPLGADGEYQESRAVLGWTNSALLPVQIADAVAVSDQMVVG
jgi:hypothetical protein